MAHTVLDPISIQAVGERIQDRSTGEPLAFLQPNEGARLATPWSVALVRARHLADHLPTAEGWIVDPACGTGIQLAAHGVVTRQPVLGIERDPDRARAAAINLRTAAAGRGMEDESWLARSRILIGDGRAADEVMARMEGNVASLILDPARPRDSRQHALEEMEPGLESILSAWIPWFGQVPTAMIDLSPRLGSAQRAEAEEIVDRLLPKVARTWLWTSRGGGRVDRLMLLLGSTSVPGVQDRYERLPRDPSEPPFHLDRTCPSLQPQGGSGKPRSGHHVTILDAAFVESGLAWSWVEEHIEGANWAQQNGRRPMIVHPKPLPEGSRGVSVATGRVMDLLHVDLTSEGGFQQIVEVARRRGVRRLTLRMALDPSLQPRLQSRFDRALHHNEGGRDAFLTQAEEDRMMALCVTESHATHQDLL